MTKKKTSFYLYVEYDYGIDTEKDKQIIKAAKAAGGKEAGSGCCLCGNQERDMTFFYPSTEKRFEARRRLKAAGIDGIRITFC